MGDPEGGGGWPESQASRDQPRVCGGGTLVFLVAGRDSVFLITRRRTAPVPPPSLCGLVAFPSHCRLSLLLACPTQVTA